MLRRVCIQTSQSQPPPPPILCHFTVNRTIESQNHKTTKSQNHRTTTHFSNKEVLKPHALLYNNVNVSMALKVYFCIYFEIFQNMALRGFKYIFIKHPIALKAINSYY